MQIKTKRLISGFLSFVLLASATSSAVSAKSIMYGDVNGDTLVNSADAFAVLSYSVGSSELSAEALTRADVNSDKRVNSADALEILRYSVGLIDRFKADHTESYDDEFAVETYNKAIERVKELRPSYKLVDTVSSHVDNVSVSSKSIFITPSMLKDAEDQIKQNNNYNKKYTKVVIQKSEDSVKRMLSSLNSLNISDLDYADCSVNENGNYLITIKFKDETNPTESSPIVKFLDQDSYAEAKKKISEENEIGGATSKVEAFDFTYKNCFIKCEIDSSNLEFIGIDRTVECVSSSKVTTVGVTAEISATGKNGANYSDFGY